MPTNRTRRTRSRREGLLTWWEKEYMLHGRVVSEGSAEDYNRYRWACLGREPWVTVKWGEHHDAILAEWIDEHPGTRPWVWWELDSPRLPAVGDGRYDDGKRPEPRQRVGGTGGEPTHQGVTFGIPDGWGNDDFDPSDPPTFESQASYLDRHGLLTKAERRALQKLPNAFQPENILAFI